MVNLNNVKTLLLNNGYTLKSTYNGNGITNHVYVSGCGVFEIECGYTSRLSNVFH